MAVLGMVVTIRGLIPLAKPFIPSLSWIVFAASTRPLPTLRQILHSLLSQFSIYIQFRIRESDEVPLVCNSVLMTSSGVVIAAATAPAIPPATQWVNGSYLLPGFSTLDKLSYTVNWMVVKGMVIARVVG
jgi:hypothetical protein